MSSNCTICQKSCKSLKNILETKIGKPSMLINDLLLRCLENNKPDIIDKNSKTPPGMCIKCENKLLEFYEATLEVSKKRQEFLDLMRPSSDIECNFNDECTKECKRKLNLKNTNSSSNDNDTDEKNISLPLTEARLQSKLQKYCQECKIECPTEEVLQLHLQKVHAAERVSTSQLLQCVQCREEFWTREMPKRHCKKMEVLSQRNLEKSKCDSCCQGLKKNTNFLADPKTPSEFLCSQCGTIFKLKRSLKTHIESEHPEFKQFQCDECGNFYNTSKSLKKHKLVHSDIKDFQCDECPRQFRFSHHLKRHKLTHTGVKPYVCPICFRTFALKYNMYSHMKEHSRPGKISRRLECGNCSQFFTAQQLLSQHLAVGGCAPPV